jgi:hypothetical protein
MTDKPHIMTQVSKGLWQCSECTRCFRLQVSPWKKTIINAGDEYVQHIGASGIVKVGAAVTPITDEDEDWLHSVGIDMPTTIE